MSARAARRGSRQRTRSSGQSGGTPALTFGSIAIATLDLWTAGRLLLMVKLPLVALAIDPAAEDPFAMPKVAASRATTYLLGAVLLALTLRHGRRLWSFSPAYPLIAAYVAANAAATLFAQDRLLALYGAPTRLLGLTTVVDLAIVAVAATALVRTSSQAAWLGLALVVADVPMLCYAALQAAHLDPIAWQDARILSTLGNAALVASYFCVVAAGAFAAALVAPRSIGIGGRAALVALALANMGGIAMTGSRAALLGSIAGAGAALMLTVVVRRWSLVRAVGAGIGLLVLGATVIAISPLGARFASFVTAGDPARGAIWTAALRVALEHPLLGIGPDGFLGAYPALHREETTRALFAAGESSVHSWLLHATVAAGALGLVALLAVLAFAVARAFRIVRAEPAAGIAAVATIAYLVQGLVTPNHVALDLILWTAVGTMFGLGRTGDGDDIVRYRERGNAARLVTASGLVVALILSVTTWQSVRASELHHGSRSALAAGRVHDAIALARSATSADGGRGAYWAQLGAALLAARDPSGAVEAFHRATSLVPYRAGNWRNVASTELALAGDQRGSHLVAAREAAEAAVRAEPADAPSHEILARALLLGGERDRALTEARAAISLDPALVGAYEILAVTYAQLGRLNEAEEAALSGLQQDPNSSALKRLLAQIYLRHGEPLRAIAIVPPPQFVALLSCGDRCYRVVFDSLDDLATTGEASALRRDNYFLGDDDPLPPGVTLRMDGRTSVVLVWPSNIPPPRSGTLLRVRDITNSLGMIMRPNSLPIP